MIWIYAFIDEDGDEVGVEEIIADSKEEADEKARDMETDYAIDHRRVWVCAEFLEKEEEE